MPRSADLIKVRNDSIATNYRTLSSAGFRHDYICELLGRQFWLTPATIEHIVRRHANPPSDQLPNQLSMFNDVSSTDQN